MGNLSEKKIKLVEEERNILKWRFVEEFLSDDEDDYSEDEDNADVFGVLSLPSGDIMASRGNELIKVTPTGAVESIVTWDAEPAIDGEPNPNFQLFVWSIARNLVTNEIGLFGFFGGFATWHETTGRVLHRTVDV